jgi:hypothetical protein
MRTSAASPPSRRHNAIAVSLSHRGCALVAAPRAYLRQTREDALRRFAPEAPHEAVPGRDVPVALRRSVKQLGFEAAVALEDLGPNLLADLDESDA